MTSIAEFYMGDKRMPFASARCDTRFERYDLVSIKGVTYRVTHVNFTVDTDLDKRGIVNQRVQVTKP